MRRHPIDRVDVARISVATSGTDFTALEAGFAAFIPAAGFALEDHLVTQQPQALGQRLIRSRRARRELDAAHFVIGPVLEIADGQHPQEWIGADKFFARGPTSHVSGGHKGGGVSIFCTG
jgi:hypothetical protein